MDPSHACFLHDGVAGRWEDAAPLTMHLKDNKIDVNQVHMAPGANEVIRMLHLHWVLMLLTLSAAELSWDHVADNTKVGGSKGSDALGLSKDSLQPYLTACLARLMA